MKNLTLGMAFLLSMSVTANDYATEFPSNSERIASIIVIKDLTKSIEESISKLHYSSFEISNFKASTKTNFCLQVGKVSASNQILTDRIELMTPPAPYMLNHAQDAFLEKASKLSREVNSKIHALEKFCEGDRKLDKEEASQITEKIHRQGNSTASEYILQNPSSELLAPMTIEELQEAKEQERELQRLEESANKKCKLF